MALSIKSADFFDQEAYSDVTVKFGGREKRCHRMILCSTSEYFKMMCGPQAAFKEGKDGIIELQEDDPDAVEAMLRHIYTFDYCPNESNKKDEWEFHLNVATAADKYGLSELESKALEAVKRVSENTTNLDEIIAMLKATPD